MKNIITKEKSPLNMTNGKKMTPCQAKAGLQT